VGSGRQAAPIKTPHPPSRARKVAPHLIHVNFAPGEQGELQRLRSIQVLRAVAALLVLFGHALRWPTGGVGVDLFFVISGYIMASIAPGRSWQQFMGDRLWRIMPVYWLNLLPWFLIAAFTGSLSYERTIASLTLWPVFSTYTQPYLELGWTLMFEMLFYAAVAFSLRFGWKLPIVAYLAFLSMGGSSPMTQFLGNPLIVEFLAGVVIFHLPRNPRIGAVTLACGAALLLFVPRGLVAGPTLDYGTLWIRVIFPGYLSAMIVYGALNFESRFQHPLFKPLVLLGDASYSLYLGHWLIVKYLPVPWPTKVALAIIAALAMYRWVEIPLRRGRPAFLRTTSAQPSSI
jgi:exopolysaccharide production protein ExoZ